MSNFTIDTQQRTPYQQYTGAECRYGYCTIINTPREYVACKAGDAAINRVTCGKGPAGVNNCHSQFQCTKMNPDVCPLGVGTLVSKSWKADYRSNPNLFNSGTNVRCVYNKESIQSADQITLLRQSIVNPDSDKIIDTEVMPYFCSLPSTSCPPDPVTGESRSVCNRLISTDREGTLCKTWAATNKSLADVSMTTYCQNNVGRNTSECNCINRSLNSDYQRLGLRSLGQDQCWWTPCRDPSSYLVPSVLQQPVTCPNVCQQITEIVADNYGTVNLNNLQQVINCDLSGVRPVDPDVPIQPIDPENIPTDPGTNIPVTPASSSNWLIWLIIGIIILIIIILIIYFATRKPPVEEVTIEKTVS
ncbi:hypothetical protein D3C87_879870 [compost metagenome]